MVKDRMLANARLIQAMDAGSAEYTACVVRQKAVFDTALRAMPNMTEDLAIDLCEAVARVGWPAHEEQIAGIMDHVVPAAELRFFGQPVAPRTKQQNYTWIEHHVPDRIWNGPREQFTALVRVHLRGYGFAKCFREHGAKGGCFKFADNP